MAVLLDKLSRIFKRNPTGDLKQVSGAVDQSLSTSSSDIQLLNYEYVLSTATGEWLDEWGSWFGINRISGETDSTYRGRMLATMTKAKNTIPAIIAATRAYIEGYSGRSLPDLDIQVYEPFVNIAKHNISAFSSADRYENYDYTRHATIDILVYNGPVTEGLVNTIEKVKSAGVKVHFTRIWRGAEDTQKILPDYEPITDMATYRDISLEVMERAVFSGRYGRSGAPLSGRLESQGSFTPSTNMFGTLDSPTTQDDSYCKESSLHGEYGDVVIVEEGRTEKDMNTSMSLDVMLGSTMTFNEVLYVPIGDVGVKIQPSNEVMSTEMNSIEIDSLSLQSVYDSTISLMDTFLLYSSDVLAGESYIKETSANASMGTIDIEESTNPWEQNIFVGDIDYILSAGSVDTLNTIYNLSVEQADTERRAQSSSEQCTSNMQSDATHHFYLYSYTDPELEEVWNLTFDEAVVVLADEASVDQECVESSLFTSSYVDSLDHSIVRENNDNSILCLDVYAGSMSLIQDVMSCSVEMSLYEFDPYYGFDIVSTIG